MRILGLLVLGVVWVGNAKAAPDPEQLMTAINADYTFKRTTWNASVLEDAHPNLKLESIYWSKKPPRFQYTVFTQLTLDRLPTLFNQCSTFLGPMSAAVYFPLVQIDVQGTDQLSHANKERIADAVGRAKGFHARTEEAGGCQLDLMLFYEVFDSEETKLLYPVNYLRNYARLQVRTKLLSMIDVDMLISRSLSDEMRLPDRIAFYEEQCRNHRAFVLPAFEPLRQGPYGREIAMKTATVDKTVLKHMHDTRAIMQFKLKVFSRGHTPTNYKLWFNTTESYDVAYKRFFEPWFITHWDVVPWYDVNFKGYGLNKIVQVASLNYYNFTFVVHPNAWLVHNPHADTAVRKVVAREASNVNKLGVKLPKNALYHTVTLLFGKAKRGMIRGTYVPATDPRMMKVFDTLDWLPKPPVLTGTPVPESVFI